MAIKIEAAPEVERRPRIGLEARQAKPVKWFAWVGVLCVALQVYVYSRWIFSGNFKATPPGPDTMPAWMTFAIHAQEILGLLLFLGIGYRVILRPWRRERRIPTVGMLYLGLITLYWQDLGSNYFNHAYTWNAHFWINRGSWYNFIPGWVSPRGNHLAEPLTFGMMVNVWGVVLPALIIAFVMRKAKERWPQVGTVGLFTVCFVMGAIIDLVVESAWVHTGLYSFTGTIPRFTLFSGHYYQFPVYELICAGLYYVAFAGLLYFKDDKGRTVIERGIDAIKVRSGSQRAWVRFLAFAGFCNLVILFYNIAFAMFSLYPGFTWNADTVNNRSYLRDQICGAGTTYACPGEDIPIPRRGGIHVSPEGELVDPAAARRAGGP